MSYKLTNIFGGQIVCDLATEGKTLRLDNRQSVVIKDSEITNHINNLVMKGLILSEKITEPKVATKNTQKSAETTQKSTEKEKEE